MQRFYPLLLLIVSLACGSAAAAERRYQATIDEAEWRLVDASRLICRLVHPIPRFGAAVFTREAGRGLRLRLETPRRFARGINVELRSESVAWKDVEKREVLAWFETNGRESLFDIPGDVARRVMAELRDGYQPGFLFYDDAALLASLSTVRFREAEVEFELCVAGLHDTNYADVRHSHIHFDADHEFASPRDEERVFDRLFDYLEVDDSISEIIVTGHADPSGAACYNDGLSERRAWYVYDLLISRGLDPDILLVDYQGENRPLSKGRDKKSLAASRRVTVELRRQTNTR